jgi:hypothetical protein
LYIDVDPSWQNGQNFEYGKDDFSDRLCNRMANGVIFKLEQNSNVDGFTSLSGARFFTNQMTKLPL